LAGISARQGMRIALLGDIEGKAEVLKELLAEIGCDLAKGLLPPDTVIVQLGDLVRMRRDRGEGGAECVQIVDMLLRSYPDRWLQLWGNHDLAAIGGPRRPSWDDPRHVLSAATLRTLREWWSDGLSRYAAAIRSEKRDLLLSHAGLTAPNWRDLGSPPAAEAAHLLNQRITRKGLPEVRAGSLVTGRVDPLADCMWAEVNFESYLPWIEMSRRGVHTRFQQVHGHASPWNWATDAWWPRTPQEIRSRCHVDHARRQTVTEVGRLADGEPAIMHSLEWGLGNLPALGAHQVYALDGELL